MGGLWGGAGCAQTVFGATLGVNNTGGLALNACGEATSDPTATTTVTGLTVGNIYNLSWDEQVGTILQPGSGKSFGVFLGTNSGGNALFLNEYLGTGWLRSSASFVATSSSQAITFAAELDPRTTSVPFKTDVDYRLDNVAIADITPANVPEPASLALLAVGAVGLRLRRRAKAD